MARVPSPHPVAHKNTTAFDVNKQTNDIYVFLRPDKKMKLGIGFAERRRNAQHLSFTFNETTVFFSPFLQRIFPRVLFEQHTKRGVFGAVRTEAYRWYDRYQTLR